MPTQKFQVSAEVSVSFTAEAIRFSKNRTIVRIQVIQTASFVPDEETDIALNDGYCFVDIQENESLIELAARVARNPFMKSLATSWSDDKSDTSIRDYNIKMNAYDSSMTAHDIGPTEGWETVHDYPDGPKLMEVQVAETHGAWYYRTKGYDDDNGVWDDPKATREDAVEEARKTGVTDEDND